MVYAKVTELSKQFMVYDAVKNRRKFLIKEENITMIEIKEKKFYRCRRGYFSTTS